MKRILPRWFGAAASAAIPTKTRHEPVFPPRPKGIHRHAPDAQRALLAAACDLPDDAVCDDDLRAALEAEIQARRAATGTLAGPSSPRVTDLRVRRRGLPDWWEGRGNLLLCAPDVAEVKFGLAIMQGPPRDQIIVVGRNCVAPEFNFAGTHGLVVIGDNSVMISSALTVGQDCTVLIGENFTATWMCFGDARNGGIVIVGDDNMWAAGVSFMTDDTHAIRDAETGRRLNIRGGRIVVERHVWLGDAVRVLGDTYIGHDGIVGTNSLVKGRRLPPNTISVGRPATPGRSGVTWTRDDGE